MNNADRQYLEVAKNILYDGAEQQDRTGTGTLSTFGIQMRFDLSKGFPLLTTKKLHTRSIILELIWFLTGKTNNNWLNERGVKIWDEWAAPDGSLGPIYGAQWRNWDPLSIEGDDRRGGIDQIADLINTIKNNPASRRQIVTAWNPSELPDMALSPCHCLFQTYVADGKLSLQLYQRSADLFLGVPFNIASYALLTHMLAQQCDLEVGEFIWVGGDTHIYTNHVEQMELQIQREPRPLPTFRFARKPDSIDDYQLEDFIIEGYDPHPHIKGDVSV